LERDIPQCAIAEWYILPDGQNVGSYKGEVFEREVGGKEKKMECQAGFLRGMGDVEISTCGLISVTIPTAIVTFHFISRSANHPCPLCHGKGALSRKSKFELPHLCVLCDNSARVVSSY
jgi:hypothetical protein